MRSEGPAQFSLFTWSDPGYPRNKKETISVQLTENVTESIPTFLSSSWYISKSNQTSGRLSDLTKVFQIMSRDEFDCISSLYRAAPHPEL